MAQKRIKSRTVTLRSEAGAFSSFFGRFKGDSSLQSQDVGLIRSILSNQKARMLHILKTKQPNSIYELAKLLGRDFKSVRQDVYTLEQIGFVEMIPIHKGKREKLKPLLVIDELQIKIEI